jgi:translin
VTAPHLDIFYTGYVENAEQEYVEASCLLAIMQGRDLPGPESLPTTSSSYLLGLCDVVGELRRAALDFMLAGEVKKATEYLRLMDQIYDAVMGFDYPSGLVPIKKKQDVIRSLLEKTRGELVVVSSEQRMGERSRQVLGVETGSKAGAGRRSSSGEDEDLDVDKVW